MVCHLLLNLMPILAAATLGQAGLMNQDAVAPDSSPASGGQWQVQLSGSVFPQDVADEAAYRRRVVERTNELIAAADRAPDPHAKLLFHLAAANWILARQVEPAMTRHFWRLAPHAADNLPEDFHSARLQLETARDICEMLIRQAPAEPVGGSDTDPDDAGRDLSAQESLIADLTVFLDAMSAVVRDQDVFDADAARDAALSLGILLEDERPGVADAAALYINMLYDRLCEFDRALSVLPAPLSPIPRTHQTLPYLLRLLRCRVIAHRGAPDVAWAFLLRIEERSQDWFVSDQSRNEAFVSALWMRKEVADRWKQGPSHVEPDRNQSIDAVSPVSEPDEAQDDSDGKPARAVDQQAAWIDAEIKRMRTLLDELSDDNTLLRIGLTVPMLTEPPDAAAQTVHWPKPY